VVTYSNNHGSPALVTTQAWLAHSLAAKRSVFGAVASWRDSRATLPDMRTSAEIGLFEGWS
jgi:hypothetical protein